MNTSEVIRNRHSIRKYKKGVQIPRKDIETMLVKGLNNRWFNTIMSTLYMMEEDLMEMSSDSVFTLCHRLQYDRRHQVPKHLTE